MDRSHTHLNGLAVRTFGPRLDAHVDGVPIAPKRAKKAKLLLALLAAHHQHDVSREWGAARLWPDSDPISGAHNLRQTLSDLRQSLGADAARIVGDGRNLRLDIAKADIDVVLFDKAVAKGDAESLKRAVDVYAGPFLEGIDEPWIIAEREPRHRSVLAALDKLACSAMETDDIDAAIAFRRKAVSLAPLDEPILRNLMTDLRTTGDHAGMVDALRAFEKLLAKEDPFARPSAETMELVRDTRTPSTPKSPRPFVELPERPPLPTALTELIGREEEIAELSVLLGRKRLVTLTGAGGVGKTRLALAVAQHLEDAYYNGAAFIDLAAINDTAMIASVIASGISLIDVLGRVSTASVIEHLRDAQLLLVLDNCEHVIDPVAEFLHMLLLRCPHIRVLATSREPLLMAGERIWQVASLIAPEHLDIDPSVASGYSAVRLFAQRAEDAFHGFELSHRNTADVIRVCRRLDGIPLAIELAAITVCSTDVGVLAEAIGRRFDLLTQGGRTMLPRHRTLRAAVDWGYELLTARERLLLCRVAVFTGGWRLEDAEAICADSGENAEIPASEMRDVLIRLVQKSFVLYESENETFRLLDTIREYATEKLELTGQLTRLRNAHLAYYRDKLTQAEENKVGARVPVWQFVSVLKNIRAAMDWSICAPDPDAGVTFCSYLAWFAADTHILNEGRARFDALLARPDLQAPIRQRAQALQMAGWFCTKQGNVDAARRYLNECCAVCRQIGDNAFLQTALIGLVEAEQVSGDIQAALMYARECMAIVSKEDESFALVRTQVATLLEMAGDYQEALGVLSQAIDYWSERTVRHTMSDLAHIQLASLYCRLGRLEDSRALIRERLEHHAFWADGMMVIVRLALATNRVNSAAVLQSAVFESLQRDGTFGPWTDRVDVLGDTAIIEKSLSSNDLAVARAQGRAMKGDEIMAFALELTNERFAVAPHR